MSCYLPSILKNDKTRNDQRNWRSSKCYGNLHNCRAHLKCDATSAETKFGLSAKRTSPFKLARGVQFIRLLAAELWASAVVMVVMLDTPCSEVECKTTGYPLHSHVSPSLPLPCVTVCHQVSTELCTCLDLFRLPALQDCHRNCRSDKAPPILHNTCEISYPLHLLPPHCIQYKQVEYSCLLSFSFINLKMANEKFRNMYLLST